jgi:hypothetical protein
VKIKKRREKTKKLKMKKQREKTKKVKRKKRKADGILRLTGSTDPKSGLKKTKRRITMRSVTKRVMMKRRCY